MQRDQASAAVLAFANDQQRLAPVHIAELETTGLGDPQPGARQQPEEGLPGMRPQLALQLAGTLHQLLDLPRTVEVRCQTTVGRSEQVGRGYPDIWELADGSFAVIGVDITATAAGQLPATASCGPDERIVRLPRGVLMGAKHDIPEPG